MNAAMIQRAVPRQARGIVGYYGAYPTALPAILQIDGVKWESPLPENSGEAQSFNEDAERICERVRNK